MTRRVIFSLLLLLIVLGALGVLHEVNAEFLPISKKLCGPFPCPAGDTGIAIAKSLVAKIIDNVRFIIGAIAIVIIVISGIKLITAGGNEEEFTKQQSTLIYSIVGLFLVVLA